MPIHLPPISRRQFLRRAVTTGAVLALQPRLLASVRPTDPNTWALLSDTHVAADRSLIVRGVNMTEHFQSVSRDLLALPQAPAGVFINGDCAYDLGQTGDYGVLADLLAPLRQSGLPIHLGLGNHDNRERFWDAFEKEKSAKRPLADRQVALLRSPHANWFILDSLEKTNSTPGLLGHEQLGWLARTLDANPDKPALVLVHHNPGLDGNLGLKDTVALFDVIRPRRQVKAYIFGHTHLWKLEEEASGMHLVNLPPVGYVFEEGNPSGWVRATLRRGGMTLELRCVDPHHKDHGQTHELTWRT